MVKSCTFHEPREVSEFEMKIYSSLCRNNGSRFSTANWAVPGPIKDADEILAERNIQNLITFLGILCALSHSASNQSFISYNSANLPLCSGKLHYLRVHLSFLVRALDGPADKSARRVVQHTQRTISQLGRAHFSM
jgi:hypothetical protein